MPGILGLCGSVAPSALDDMQAVMAHLPWHVRSRATIAGDAIGACVALHSPVAAARVVEEAGVTAWIHGELYGTSDGELARALIAPDAPARLARIDGNFAVVAWHRGARRLRLATDRLGLRHLYWGRVGQGLVWASEAKACAAASPTLRTLRAEAARELLDGGHLRGDGTWFAGVALVPAATLLTFDVASARLTREQTWTWPETPAALPAGEVVRIAARLGERWREVHEAYRALPGRAVITLSGGLDSRAILAAQRAVGASAHLVTFGRPDCLDVRLARAVAARTRWPHDVCELGPDSWLDDRALATWITDGQFDLRHMHVVRCLRRCVEVGDVVLNGFLGDALLGGGYLSSRWTIEERYRERGRRFIAEGTRMGESFVPHRLPFCDAEMVELSLAIPARLRRGGAFYQRFLRAAYPSLFATIGHTPHGAPVRASALRRAASAAWHWLGDRYDYHAYRRWVTLSAAAERLTLDPARARFPAMLDEEAWRGPVQRWRTAVARGRPLGARDCDRVLRLAGIELWLGQVAARIATLGDRVRRDVA